MLTIRKYNSLHPRTSYIHQLSPCTPTKMDLQKEPPFIRLPAELRNIIYALTLQDATTAINTVSHTSPPPGILLAFKQTHYETIYYRATTFEFQCFNHATLWINNSMRKKHGPRIKRVKVFLHEVDAPLFMPDENATKSYYARLLSHRAMDRGLKLEHVEMVVHPRSPGWSVAHARGYGR